ncbi:MAG TPA: hypothetical protein VFQ61_10970 [Polyangiaceae bacterium]|nr:hypothetical protein [Polyangiaceae bacterium]
MTPSSSPSHSQAIGRAWLRLLWRLTLAACVISGVGAFASEAAAQSIAITNTNTIVRRSNRPSGLLTTTINQADCAANDTLGIKMNVVVGGLSSPKVSVVASTMAACDTDTAALADANRCWPVDETTSFTETFELRVQKIIKPRADGGDVCDSTDDSIIGVSLYFLLMDGATVNKSTKLNVKYDLAGPAPPTGLSIGSGENKLYPKWPLKTNSFELIKQYNVYCELASPDSVVTGAGDGAAGAGTSGGCTSENLVPGKPAPDDLRKGFSAPVAGKGVAKGLENYSVYACGIAVVDKNENVGVLSELVCGMPEPVTGFYDAYRGAGGEAGGGYCAFGRQPAAAGAGLIALAGAGLVARRRKRVGRGQGA